MIERVNIVDLRGIREADVSGLTALTVLTGPNGSGKSTVLDALLVGASPIPETGLARAVSRRPWMADAAWWLFRNHGAGARVDVHVGERTRSNILRVMTAVSADRTSSREPEIEIGMDVQLGGPNVSTLFVQVGVRYPLRITTSLAQFVGVRPSMAVVGRIELVDLASRFETGLKVVELQAARRRVGVELRLLELLNELLAGESLNIGVDESGLGRVNLRGRDGTERPVEVEGEGTVAAVGLALLLADFEPGDVALLEEPELHLHPRAIWTVARVILEAVSRGVQVILTTHSLELIDALVGQAGDQIEKLSVVGTALRDGKLVTSRSVGEAVARLRNDIDEDLR